MRLLQTSIGILAVFDANDKDQHDVVVDCVDSAIDPIADAIHVVLADDRFRTLWTWIVRQCFDFGKKTLLSRQW